jgi:hypothetical protein
MMKHELNIEAIKEFLIVIENLSSIKEEIKHYHPDDPRYVSYWQSVKKKCIEGFWIEEFGAKRFVPGRLYFYGNYCTILDVNEEENTRIKIKPDIRDIEWIRSYMVLEAEGFSGWSEDDTYSSDIVLKEKDEGLLKRLQNSKNPRRYKTLLKPDGSYKDYIPAWENITKLHDKDKGRAYYWNQAKNINELGSRGGGKSYYYSLAVGFHEICFNGLKYYTEASRGNPPKAEVCIGSGRTDKSSEFVKKIEVAMNELAINPELGAFGKLGDDSYSPSPLYKEMKGTLKPNNKANPWRHEYEINSNGQWATKGSGSYVAHVSYSPQKKEGGEAAAGGRYGKVIYEEIGLTELLEEAYQSNKATVAVEGTQFGCQIGLGTSGNMETILPAKKWFLNPEQFDTIAFDDIYEHTGKIGFFLPVFLTARQFKDDNGNTDVEAAVNFYMTRREKYIKNKDAKGLEGEMMNYPVMPSEMFLQNVGNRLPVPELIDHQRNISQRFDYASYATAGELIFDPTNKYGVKFTPDVKAQLSPIKTYPVAKGVSQDGAVVIYEHPIEERVIGEKGTFDYMVPQHLYVIGHDPTAKDHTSGAGSLASIFVLKTSIDPVKFGYFELVAEFIGRPYEGREKVNEILEKLAMYYGASPGMIFFENQVGNTKEYFQKKGKLGLLSTQPQRVFNPRGGWMKQTTYGYPMSNKLIKDNAIDYLADWLKEPRTLSNESEAEQNHMNLHMLKSPRLIQEMIQYNDKDNFDGVMGFLGCIIGIREKFNKYKQQEEISNQIAKTNDLLDFFRKNDYILNKQEQTQSNER